MYRSKNYANSPNFAMSETSWDAGQAWNHLVNGVFQASDTLPFFAYAVRCNDVDDFLYLGYEDFGIEFDASSLDEKGETVVSRQTLLRVLVGKLIRAQRWYDSQEFRDYGTWAHLNLRILNEFRVERTGVLPTTPGNVPSTPTMYTSIPITPTTENMRSESSVTTFVKSIKQSTEDYPNFQDAKSWFNWQR